MAEASELKFILRALVISGAVLLVLATIFYKVYLPWQLTWGATDEEVHRAMPGDEIVRDPPFNATRAVTIEARPEQIWPWIVQIGYRRAGFYSHDWLDNDGIPSAERILPEHQKLALGDAIPLSEANAAVVRVLEPRKFLVLVYPEVGAPWMTWTWGLYEQDSEQTRLVTRLRVDLDSTVSKLWWDAFEIIMMRKCLLGIKRRVEAHPSGGPKDPVRGSGHTSNLENNLRHLEHTLYGADARERYIGATNGKEQGNDKNPDRQNSTQRVRGSFRLIRVDQD